MTTGDVLLVQHRGPAAWLILNRPAALNTLTPEIMRALHQRLGELRDNPAVRVVVLTGAGRAFCAGVDLSAVATAASVADATAAFIRVAEPAVEALRQLPKPVIAAVNGHALAGGLELVLGCDFIVAAEEACFGDGHANFGLIPGGGSTARLPRRIGVGLAKYMIFTGAQVDSLTLQAAGLITQVVPRAGLEAAVDALVARLADKSPLALARCKWLIDTGMEKLEKEAVRTETETTIAHCRSRDVAEGLAAFAAKRKPVFTGE